MDITLRQIKYFIAAAETGKIVAAANMLSISPSSITESIKELESITGVTLITRHRRGINLTFDGYRFLQHCHNINAFVSDAEYALKNSYTDISGDLALGITITVAGYFLASPLARFKRTFPNIRVKLGEFSRNRIEMMLMEGKLDLSVLLVSNVNNEDLLLKTLVSSKRRLWTSVNHSLCSKKDITLKDVSKEPYIQLLIDEAGVTHMNFRGDGTHINSRYNHGSKPLALSPSGRGGNPAEPRPNPRHPQIRSRLEWNCTYSGLRMKSAFSPRSTFSICAAMFRDVSRSVSSVIPDRWGVTTTLDMENRGLSFSGGSGSKTSSAAPAI